MKVQRLKRKQEFLGAIMLTTYKMRTIFKNNYNDVFLNMTDEDCYIIGFIMADGHISKHNNGIYITLAEVDKDILVQLNLYIILANSFIKIVLCT